MILPTKGIAPRQALLTVGAEVLRRLPEPRTVSALWDELRTDEQLPRLTYDWFVLGLDLLYLMGAVELERGKLRRRGTE